MNGYPGNNAPRIVTNIMDEAETVTGAQGTAYTYDVLNRLRSMQAYAGLDDDNDWNVASALSAYHTRYTYDGNGNITSLVRRGYDVYVDMDSLDYHYYAGTNRLEYVNDAWGGTPLPDIDNQSPGNYTYDPIGNLINDASESIDNITWTVYGKIESVVRATASDSTHLLFSYGSDGNRVRKITVKEGTTDTTWTWYVRDAQGNVMGIYSLDTVGPADTLMLKEHYVYGSSRLGYVKKEVAVLAADTELDSFTRVLGCMNYELSNHLGNVLAVVSDQKIPVDETANDTINYFLPNVLTWSDFYPFGMIMPGRSGGEDYRHGFNGKEQDPEVSGTGNQYDYGFRIYNPRLGKFLSVDPLMGDYAMLTPYQFSSNRPIDGIDLDGLEYLNADEALVLVMMGTAWIKIENFTRYNQDLIRDYYWDRGSTFGLARRNPDGTFTGAGMIGTVIQQAPSTPPSASNAAEQATGTIRTKAEKTKQGLPDRRVKERTINTSSSKGMFAFKGIAFLIDAINTVGTIAGIRNMNQMGELNNQVANKVVGDGWGGIDHVRVSPLNQALGDVAKAAEQGKIPPKFMNVADLSAITNIVLYGGDGGESDEIKDVGFSILQESGNCTSPACKGYQVGKAVMEGALKTRAVEHLLKDNNQVESSPAKR